MGVLAPYVPPSNVHKFVGTRFFNVAFYLLKLNPLIQEDMITSKFVWSKNIQIVIFNGIICIVWYALYNIYCIIFIILYAVYSKHCIS